MRMGLADSSSASRALRDAQSGHSSEYDPDVKGLSRLGMEKQTLGGLGGGRGLVLTPMLVREAVSQRWQSPVLRPTAASIFFVSGSSLAVTPAEAVEGGGIVEVAADRTRTFLAR